MSRENVSHDAIIVINEKKRELGVFIAITLLVLIILIVFPIRLMALKVIQVNNEIRGKREMKEHLDTKINNFTQLNTEYQEIKDNLGDFTLIFPNQGDYSLFVANMDEICKANYFQLRSVSVNPERARRHENPFEMLNFWSVNINVVGRRSDLISLLQDIESMPMYPTVQSLNYKNDQDEDGFLSFTILVRIYGVDDAMIYFDI